MSGSLKYGLDIMYSRWPEPGRNPRELITRAILYRIADIYRRSRHFALTPRRSPTPIESGGDTAVGN